MGKVSNKQKNVWLVFGDDAVLIQEKKNELIRRYFKNGAPDPAVLGSGAGLPEISAALGGQSLFSSASAVVIAEPYFLKRALRKEDEKPYEAFLDELRGLSEDIFVVMTYAGKPDRRLKAVKSLLAYASTIECTLMKAEDGLQMMEEYLYDRGKRLAPDARAYLESVLSAWTEISEPFLASECDKIQLMCGDAKTVTKDLLVDALPSYMDQGIFHFYDLLIARNAAAVREGIPQVFTDQETELKNTGFLASKFRQIKMLKEMAKERPSPAEKVKRLGLRSSWQLRGLEADAKRMTEKEAEDFLLGLFRCRYHARLSGAETEIGDVLLRFCLRDSQ